MDAFAMRHTEFVMIDIMGSTVDGRNPAPLEVGSSYHYLQGFFTSQLAIAGFLNHQLYHPVRKHWTKAHKYIKKKLVSLSCKVYEVHSSTCVFPRILWVCDKIFIASWVGEWHPELGDWKDPASSKCVKFHKISTQNITQKLPKITQGRNCTIL